MFDEYSFALRFRDIIKQMVTDQIDQIRPRLQYATVVAIDRVNRKCTVTYPGDATQIPVNMGSIQPSAVGQTVRIEGIAGDRFVTDVMGSCFVDASQMGTGATSTDGMFTAGTYNSNPALTSGGLASASRKIWLGTTGPPDGTSNHDMIRYDDVTNRFHFVADSSDPAANGNAEMQAARYYDDIGTSLKEVIQWGMTCTGGGLIGATSTGVSWSQRFVAFCGRGPEFAVTDGYFEITQPPDGTVITGVGGAVNVTVAGGLVPINSWCSLYYILPIGGARTTLAANFRVVSYTATFEIPWNWVQVVSKNNDSMSSTYRFCTGTEVDYWRTPTMLNSWVNYGSGYANAGYQKANGVVTLQGLVKSGTVGSGTAGAIFLLPVGFRPATDIIIAVFTGGNTLGRLNIGADGNVVAYFGSNTYFPLDASFVAGG